MSETSTLDVRQTLLLIVLVHQAGGILTIPYDAIESTAKKLAKEGDVTVGIQETPEGLLLINLYGEEIDVWDRSRIPMPEGKDATSRPTD